MAEVAVAMKASERGEPGDDTLIEAVTGCAAARVGDEAVLLDERGVYYGLNEVGRRVWELVQAPLSLRELEAAILLEFEVDQAQCQADLVELLLELRRRGLVTFRERRGA